VPARCYFHHWEGEAFNLRKAPYAFARSTSDFGFFARFGPREEASLP
jgi:hypothetical protein